MSYYESDSLRLGVTRGKHGGHSQSVADVAATTRVLNALASQS